MNAVPSTTSPHILEDCLAAAVTAPSAHNTQPWRFRVLRETLDLIADRTRALPVNDPYDRELTISCGAALFNLRTAAAARGWAALVDEFPFEDDPDLLARITLCSDMPAGIEDAKRLAAAIPVRRTYRKRFSDQAPRQTDIDSLILAAERESCFAAPIGGDVRREAAVACISEADELLWNEPSWRREIASWMHPQREHEGFAIPGLSRKSAELVVRSFDLGSGVAARDSKLLEGTPLLLVVGTAGDEPADWLHCGQALERVLLTAD